MERKNLVILALATLAVVFFAISLTLKPTVLEVDPQSDTQHYVRMLDIKNMFDLNENTDALYVNDFIFMEKSILNIHGYELTMLEEREDGSILVIFLNKNHTQSITIKSCDNDKFEIGGKTYSLIDLMAPLVVETIE